MLESLSTIFIVIGVTLLHLLFVGFQLRAKMCLHDTFASRTNAPTVQRSSTTALRYNFTWTQFTAPLLSNVQSATNSSKARLIWQNTRMQSTQMMYFVPHLWFWNTMGREHQMAFEDAQTLKFMLSNKVYKYWLICYVLILVEEHIGKFLPYIR